MSLDSNIFKSIEVKLISLESCEKERNNLGNTMSSVLFISVVSVVVVSVVVVSVVVVLDELALAILLTSSITMISFLLFNML